MKEIKISVYPGPVPKTLSSNVHMLDAEHAWALAQFLKRFTFTTCENHACDKEEAYKMIHALNVVRHAVNEAGFNPR